MGTHSKNESIHNVFEPPGATKSHQEPPGAIKSHQEPPGPGGSLSSLFLMIWIQIFIFKPSKDFKKSADPPGLRVDPPSFLPILRTFLLSNLILLTLRAQGKVYPPTQGTTGPQPLYLRCINATRHCTKFHYLRFAPGDPQEPQEPTHSLGRIRLPIHTRDGGGPN